MHINRDLLVGVGIGLILASSLLSLESRGGSLGELAVVQRARQLGMIFPGEERSPVAPVINGSEAPPGVK